MMIPMGAVTVVLFCCAPFALEYECSYSTESDIILSSNKIGLGRDVPPEMESSTSPNSHSSSQSISWWPHRCQRTKTGNADLPLRHHEGSSIETLHWNWNKYYSPGTSIYKTAYIQEQSMQGILTLHRIHAHIASNNIFHRGGFMIRILSSCHCATYI